MMNKLTVVLNDYGTNVKMYITYDASDRKKLSDLWSVSSPRLSALQHMEVFDGYDTWEELTVSHYRVLITQGLTVLSQMKMAERANHEDENVAMAKFLILAFVRKLEEITGSEIEQFRINRFDGHNVTFDYSASFDLNYDAPRAKNGKKEDASGGFSIVVDNLDDRKD